MRALIQRVRQASVLTGGQTLAETGSGLLVYLGIHRDDTEKDSEWIIRKILQARIFENTRGKMASSVLDVSGDILVVSEITLYGCLLQGNRPDLGANLRPDLAEKFFELFVSDLRLASKLRIEQGQFGAHMEIRSANDGPVTVLLDSLERHLSTAKG